jgi:glycosyltransferase involved in cell wall biosynthesis
MVPFQNLGGGVTDVRLFRPVAAKTVASEVPGEGAPGAAERTRVPAKPVAAVLMTRVAIPHPKIGSWTTMFDTLFSQSGQPIDYLICPPVAACRQLPCVEYVFASDTSVPVLRRYVPSSRFALYFRRLRQLSLKHEHLVLLIVDDYNFLFAAHDWLVRLGMRARTSVVFFIHGMSYFFETSRASSFYRSIDEIVYLTHTSYALERTRTVEMPCEASVVWNGVDKTRFHPVDRATKAARRTSLGLQPDGVCFLWLSQDRPKKGLHIVLRAWSEFSRQHKNVELAVIGAEPRGAMERVTWFGRIPHDQVAPYVQMADIYLFPTLWPEGFGLSVAEALSAGLLTIASDIGPMAEVLDGGRYGHLVKEPHVVDNWTAAMETELARFVARGFTNPFEPLEQDRYSIEGWCEAMRRIVDKWKARARANQVACAR